jgi:Zn-finger nucleic acid-binding protein
MKSNQKQNKGEEGELRLELKYCERCGGLWLRECGAGKVYCASCEREVADLPVPKKKPQRVRMPVVPRSVAEEYRRSRKQNRFNQSFSYNNPGTGTPDDDLADGGGDLEASGGAA